MSTHACIIVPTPLGQFYGVYLHSDGYVAHAGKILKEHYATLDRARELVKHGNISVLAKWINRPDEDKPHNFNERQKDTCVFYGRDRGMTCQDPVYGITPEAIADAIDNSGHVYLWHNGDWLHNGVSFVWPEDVDHEADKLGLSPMSVW